MVVMSARRGRARLSPNCRKKESLAHRRITRDSVGIIRHPDTDLQVEPVEVLAFWRFNKLEKKRAHPWLPELPKLPKRSPGSGAATQGPGCHRHGSRGQKKEAAAVEGGDTEGHLVAAEK
jgi:hypothetical protein